MEEGRSYPTMDLLRSETMQLAQLIIPMELTHRSISYLGDLGLFQFKDRLLHIQKSPVYFMRKFCFCMGVQQRHYPHHWHYCIYLCNCWCSTDNGDTEFIPPFSELHWVEFQNKFYEVDGYEFYPWSFASLSENEE